MNSSTLRPLALLGLAVLAACNTTTPYNPLDDYEQLNPAIIMATPEAAPGNSYPEEAVNRGRYLTGLLGCGSCHTDGALLGTPDESRLLAGSRVGIAYSNPLAIRNPGVVYPSNLTPDPQTGIGNWSLEDIVRLLQTGVDSHGGQTLPVMPWPSFSYVTEDDATAIAMYLKSLPPVRHQVPSRVTPGQRATNPFIHFGVYRSKM